MNDSGRLIQVDLKRPSRGACRNKLWINIKRMKKWIWSEWPMALQCLGEIKKKKKNSLSDSYLQMFAGVIEQVNFLSASLAYQLLTSTDWGYLTFIVRRARYWLSWCDFWHLLTSKNFLTVCWKAFTFCVACGSSFIHGASVIFKGWWF